ncbi:unnamed protein product [Mycena citricolor]|uniref:Phosphodiesterase n=1 Tax=Mycena citricolor TaxID=2018698 RepID=A0AAD2HEL4_9AGAR|nr:unnamed protein product [Mycena citricolor]
MCGHSQHLVPPTPRQGRRRSADIGGLSLATKDASHGQGWLGHSDELQTHFAELLSDMYTETLNAVNDYATEAGVMPELSDDSRASLVSSLDSWNFDPRILPSEDHVAICTVLIFDAIFRIEGMEEAVGVTPAQIPRFVQHLRHIYRQQNSYHNFDHALDVLQATYCYLRASDMVPPLSIILEPPHRIWRTSRGAKDGYCACLCPTDIFILAIAAIGHDVGHPGFTNQFMQNASAPLAAVYEGRSPLEQLHCALLIRVMRAHGMGALLEGGEDLDGESGQRINGGRNRRLLLETVLATDMRVHDAFMKRFAELVSGRGEQGLAHRRLTICQALIKCADISNPSRPFYISQHWATQLQREWNAQAALEAHHQLPRTVEDSDHPLRAASSQMFFIPTFVKPLLESVSKAIPELKTCTTQCDLNMTLWAARLSLLQAAADVDNKAPTTKSATKPSRLARSASAFNLSSAFIAKTKLPAPPIPPPPSPLARIRHKLRTRKSVPLRPPEDYSSAFPLTLPPQHARTPPIRGSVGSTFSWTVSEASKTTRSVSPSEEDAESEASFTFSPSSRGTSRSSIVPATPSESSSSDGNHTIVVEDGTASIRAAARTAGLRGCGSRGDRYMLHRNSWSPYTNSEGLDMGEWTAGLGAAEYKWRQSLARDQVLAAGRDGGASAHHSQPDLNSTRPSPLQVVNARSSLLSNYEVLTLLRELESDHLARTKTAHRIKKEEEAAGASNLSRAGGGRDPTVVEVSENLRTVSVEAIKYLSADYQPTGLQAPEAITQLVKSLAPYDLTKAEMLQIVNLAPQSHIELYVIVEELEDRLAERMEEAIAHVKRSLGQGGVPIADAGPAAFAPVKARSESGYWDADDDYVVDEYDDKGEGAGVEGDLDMDDD